jgi:MarC family membrane protein
METSFLSATFLLILITDPLGNIPLFIAALEQVRPERRVRLITREVCIACAVLLVFLVGGRGFMALLRLSDEALRVAGGVILLLIAIDMVFPHRTQGISGGRGLKGEPFIVPLAIPLIAGPSAMATVLLLATGHPGRTLEWAGAILLSMAVSYLVFLLAIRLRDLLGTQAIAALERLMGLVLTAIAVEMLLGGVSSYIRHVPAP